MKEVLTALRTQRIRAHFFSIGRPSATQSEFVEEAAAEGHIVGSSSITPVTLKGMPEKEARDLIREGKQSVARTTGTLSPFFRFPYGAHNEMLEHIVAKEGLTPLSGQIDSTDWKIQDPAQLYAHLIERLDRQKSGIIHFHDRNPSTAVVLPYFLSELHRRGLQTVVFVPR